MSQTSFLHSITQIAEGLPEGKPGRGTLQLPAERRRRVERAGWKGLHLGFELPVAEPVAVGFRPVSTEDIPEGGAKAICNRGDGGIVTIAGTGAGKGISQVIPTLLTYPGGVIVTDPKGEIAAVTADRRREMGQKVYIVDPFGREPSHAINPLAVIRPLSPEAPEQCAEIAARIVPSTKTNDPFWENMSRKLLTGTLLFISIYAPKEMRNLTLLRRFWSSGEERLSEVLSMMMLCPDYGGLIRDTATAYASAPDRTRTSLLTCVQEPLNFLNSQRAEDSLQGDEIDYDAFLRGEPMTIYLRVPPQYAKGQAALLRNWLGTLITLAASRTSRPEIPDLLLIDEAAQLGRSEDLSMAASLLRGYGIRTWTFWQSLGQLEELYGPRHREFLDNAEVLSVFGLSNAVSVRAAALLTGVDEESLFGMPRDQQVLALAGERGRRARRVNYLETPELAAIADPNPFYTRREYYL